MLNEIKAIPNARVFRPDHELLEPGELGAILEWEVRDKEGQLAVDPRTSMLNHGKKKAESFVRQFLELLVVVFAHPSVFLPWAIRDTGNTVRNAYVTYPGNDRLFFQCNGGVGDTNQGVVVGTGNTAPTIDDYKLETPIAHGVGAGQLSYAAQAWGVPASDVTTSHFTVTRNISNNSGGAITVNEVALYVQGYDGSARYFMIIRDVIAGGINVPNGQTLTVNYRPIANV